MTSASFSGNYANATATAYASVFATSRVTATATANASACGGAIAHESGDLTLTSASFSGNYAYATANATAYVPGILAYYGYAYASAWGGAIAASNAILTLTDTTFSGNRAVASARGYHTCYYYSLGGAIYLSKSAMTYQVSLNNDVFNCGNWADSGGFIYLEDSTATFDIAGTLTIGELTGQNDAIAGTAESTITKTGSGVMTVNSDISEFSGDWILNSGILKLERISRSITLDDWTIGVDAELHLSALNDTITIGMDKKIGIIDLGGGSDTINTGGYHLSGGKLRVSTLTISGGGRVSSEITTRTAGEAFDITLNNVVLASNITGGNGADQLRITQSSEFSGLIALGDGSNTITASSGTVTTFSNTLSAGKDDDLFSFDEVKFIENVDLGQGNNNLTATGSAVFGGTVETGSGNDTLTVGAVTFNQQLALGDGNNKITADKAVFAQGISEGSGDDTITLKGDSAISGVAALGGGKNYIYNSQNLDFNGSFKLDSDGETHLIIYKGASLADNALTVYANEGAEMISTTLDWNDIAGLDKVRILVSSDATFETFEFTVELYNQTKSFTLNMEEGYFIQFQAQDEDGWAQRLLTDEVAPGQVGGFAMTGTTANWAHAYDNVDGNGVKHYNIQVAADADFNSVIGTYTSMTNSYSFASYADGNYFIRIQAEDYTGNKGEWSNIENLLIDTVAPRIPVGFNETISGYNATLDWSDVSDTGVSGVKGYYVRYGLSDVLSGEGEFIAASEFDLTDLPVGTYFYQVKTEDKAGNISEWSAIQSFEIVPGAVQNLRGDSNGLSWDAIPGVESYIVEYSTDNFATVMAFETTSNKVDSMALPVGTYQWRVKAEAGEFVNGEAIVSDNGGIPQEFVSDADGNTDLFFGKSAGVWGSDYAARHLGTLDGWGGTFEKVVLSGKNKISDIFEGSTDANILVLTDDANGDALFVDDIYTALGEQSRIVMIDEIRTGAGDDIVDMTSQRYAYTGDGVKVYGGLGNDTIWANKGSNTLFGDAGNDRLVGASGNDVIVGGSGNDSMHGGGGEDIFTFGGAFGQDAVEQLAEGSVTLWFETGSESNWNALTMTYTDGVNSVTVSGSVNVTLRFGAEASLPAGCFETETSKKIFEDKGILA